MSHTSKQSSQKHKSSVSVELLRLVFFQIFTRHQSLNADHSILLFIYVITVDNFEVNHMILVTGMYLTIFKMQYQCEFVVK